MAENKILPWAQTGTANVLSDADYEADVATGGLYGDGVNTGQASSQQANKTWRQGTSVAAGLAQFLVDNLAVDVTDADVPATFSSRITNAIIMLGQISNFNQSFATAIGGYKKYAIVSDSSGNYWSSTADQNVTVPGASGANWQNLFNGYATNTALTQGLAGKQPIGDYATNTALSTEASSRASADTSLQNQINNRVVKTGDTMTGQLNVNAAGGIQVNYDPGGQVLGQTTQYARLASVAGGRGANFSLYVQELVGSAFAGILSLTYPTGYRFLALSPSGRFTDSVMGGFAYTSDLPNMGNYVSQSQYQNDFATSDSRVINLPYEHRIQAFTVTVDGNGSNSHRITYPQSFSGNSTATFNCNDTGQSRSVSLANGTQPDSTGFNISVSVHGNSTGPSTDGLTLTVIAIGPK